MCVFIVLVKVTEWPPIGKIAAHSAYNMFHGICAWWLVWFFPASVFWSGNPFLIAPFPGLYLLVPSYNNITMITDTSRKHIHAMNTPINPTFI